MAFDAGDYIQSVVGISIAGVILAVVGVPLMNEAITENNITGSTATILKVLPVVLAVSLVLGAVSLFYFKRRA